MRLAFVFLAPFVFLEFGLVIALIIYHLAELRPQCSRIDSLRSHPNPVPASGGPRTLPEQIQAYIARSPHLHCEGRVVLQNT